MKFNIKLITLIFFTGIILTACNKENIDDTNPIKTPIFDPSEIGLNNLALSMTSGTDDGLALGCIQVNFPLELVLEDQSQTTINTFNEYKEAIDAPAPNRVSDITYPVTGIDQNGESVLFDNNSELGSSFASCIPKGGWVASTRSNATIPAFLLNGYCFELVYPVSLEDEDGNSYTADNEDEFIDLCVTIEPLFFTLPLTVLDFEGNELEFGDVASFFEALVECEGISPPVVGDGIQVIGFGCHTLEYPFDVALEDGTIQTINDEDEYAILLLSGVSVELQFPFSLTHFEGETFVINNFEDLIMAFAACGIIIDITPIEGCGGVDGHVLLFFNQGSGTTGCGYDVVYPVQAEVGGTAVEFADINDYFDAYNSGDEIIFIYPVNITILEDNSSSNFASYDELCAYILDCE